MERIGKVLLMGAVLLSTFGCAQNYYSIPKESYEAKVRVLGIAPIFVDDASDIRHPDKEAVLPLVREANRKNERELLRLLKETGVYFSIRFIEGDSDQLYASLQPRREKRSDAGVTYNKYFFDTATISRLIKENGVDAVALMVVSGINRRDKISSGNLLSTLEADYNDLILTAQIIDAEGTVLWEYPNFKKRNPNIPPLLRLQYPDFDEAEANETDKVEVKFKTVAGIGRALQRKDKDMLRRETRLSYRYSIVFDDMLSLLNPSNGLMGGKKKAEAPEKPAGEGR